MVAVLCCGWWTNPRTRQTLSARYYRQKAAEARQVAEEATTRAIKERLHGSARNFDKLAAAADRAEQTANPPARVIPTRRWNDPPNASSRTGDADGKERDRGWRARFSSIEVAASRYLRSTRRNLELWLARRCNEIHRLWGFGGPSPSPLLKTVFSLKTSDSIFATALLKILPIRLKLTWLVRWASII